MKYILSLFICFQGILCIAQRASCGYHDHINALAERTPGFLKEMNEVNEQARKWQEGKQSSAVITIPVVVHVIYRTPEQNISDEQIKSQIRVLNQDYNRRNADRLKTPAAFESIAANAEILFCLAQLDPDGNPTNGITRTSTTIPNIGSQSSSAYYQTSAGGQDIWDRDSYLNIWVCEVDNDLLGFATPPALSTSQDLDGVVIGYQYFGTIGNLEDPHDKGRTATHEIGHWLGLEHPWGDGDPSGNNCAIDDGISDTPNQQQANYFCPTFPSVSCSNGPNGDMFMNFMDYSDDDCMNLFTEGQKTRMMAILNSAPRNTLQNSAAGCSFTGIQTAETNIQNLKLYPNPSAGSFSISNLKTSIHDLKVTIYNIAGKAVYQEDFELSSSKIQVETGLKDGVYFVSLKQNNQETVERLIIQNL